MGKSKKEDDKVKKFLKKGQNWSMDLILGIVVFLLILAVFYILISKKSTVDINGLKSTGNKVLNALDSTKSDASYTFIDGNKINITKFENLYTSGDYELIRQDLGLTGNFCIVLEDENGRVVVVSSGAGGNIYGFGNESLNISGCLCGQTC
jgi:hypothetical protein